MCVSDYLRQPSADSLVDEGSLMSTYSAHESSGWKSGLFSDWTIVVGERRFKVHKFALGVGPRSSSMLYNIFQNESYQDHHDCSTTIGLEHTCSTDVPVETLSQRFIEAFEQVLAFIYEGTAVIKMETCMPMWRLADYLCITQLVDQVREFVSSEVTPFALDTLLHQAHMFGVGEVASICARRCARRFAVLDVELLQRQSPEFIAEVLECTRLVGPQELASSRLAEYLRQRPLDDPKLVSRLVHAIDQHPKQHFAVKDAALFMVCMERAGLCADPLFEHLADQVAANLSVFARSDFRHMSWTAFVRVFSSPRLNNSRVNLLQYLRAFVGYQQKQAASLQLQPSEGEATCAFREMLSMQDVPTHIKLMTIKRVLLNSIGKAHRDRLRSSTINFLQSSDWRIDYLRQLGVTVMRDLTIWLCTQDGTDTFETVKSLANVWRQAFEAECDAEGTHCQSVLALRDGAAQVVDGLCLSGGLWHLRWKCCRLDGFGRQMPSTASMPVLLSTYMCSCSARLTTVLEQCLHTVDIEGNP